MTETTEWLTPAQAAETIGVSPKTLANWRWLRTGPQPFRYRHLVRYRRADVERWMDAAHIPSWEAS